MPVVYARPTSHLVQGILAYSAGRMQARQRAKEMQAAMDERRNAQIAAILQDFGKTAGGYLQQNINREDVQAHDLTRMERADEYQTERDKRLQQFGLETMEKQFGYRAQEAVQDRAWRTGERIGGQEYQSGEAVLDRDWRSRLYKDRDQHDADLRREMLAGDPRTREFELQQLYARSAAESTADEAVPADIRARIAKALDDPIGGKWEDMDGVLGGILGGLGLKPSMSPVAAQAAEQIEDLQHQAILQEADERRKLQEEKNLQRGLVWNEDDTSYQRKKRELDAGNAFIQHEEARHRMGGEGATTTPEELKRFKKKVEIGERFLLPGTMKAPEPAPTVHSLYRQQNGIPDQDAEGNPIPDDPWVEGVIKHTKDGPYLELKDWDDMYNSDLKTRMQAAADRGEEFDYEWDRIQWDRAFVGNNAARREQVAARERAWQEQHRMASPPRLPAGVGGGGTTEQKKQKRVAADNVRFLRETFSRGGDVGTLREAMDLDYSEALAAREQLLLEQEELMARGVNPEFSLENVRILAAIQKRIESEHKEGRQ